MKTKKQMTLKLAEYAFKILLVKGITICLQKIEPPVVHTDYGEEHLKKKLILVTCVYHAIGILYNE